MMIRTDSSINNNLKKIFKHLKVCFITSLELLKVSMNLYNEYMCIDEYLQKEENKNRLIIEINNIDQNRNKYTNQSSSKFSKITIEVGESIEVSQTSINQNTRILNKLNKNNSPIKTDKKVHSSGHESNLLKNKIDKKF